MNIPTATPSSTTAATGTPAGGVGGLWRWGLPLYDHSHITTPQHAALFKTARLQYSVARGVEYVGVKFDRFEFNAATGRSEPVFETSIPGLGYVGDHYVSNFESLCL